MNLKYKQLSVIGKAWTIAELYNAGIRYNKKSYIKATMRKLEDLESENINTTSYAIKENTISNIMQHITKETPEYCNDNSIVSIIWYNRAWLDDIKIKINENTMLSSDVPILEDIYLEIKRLWVADLKSKKLTPRERQDLFEIKEEIKNVVLKLNNLIKHSQLEIVW